MEFADKLSYTISGKHAYLASLYVHKSGVPTPSDRRLDYLATVDIVYSARILDRMRQVVHRSYKVEQVSCSLSDY